MALLTRTFLPTSLRATKALDIRFYFIAFLLAINIHNDHFGIQTLPICSAGPMPTSLVLPPSSSSVDSPTIRVVNLTRQHGGDTFTAFGKLFVWIFFRFNCNHFINYDAKF